MTRFIIHIGTHKTGTTSIQEFFSANRDAFLAQGIDFPIIGRTPMGAQAHRYFSAYFRGKPVAHPVDFGETISKRFTSSPICILSSEGFYFCSRPSSLRRMFEYFGAETMVVCYFRDPID